MMAKNNVQPAAAAGATDDRKAKQEALLKKALADLQKAFGESAVRPLAQFKMADVDVISTGSLALDLATGIGGLPRGRIVEVYGPESSGKSTICQHVVANAQKMGLNCAYIDMEHAVDPRYAKKIGVNLETLLFAQPDNGEQALEMVETLVRSGAVGVVVVDSVAALVPRSEIEGDMGDATMGMQARLMSQALRKINAAVSQTNTLVIFTNQLRQKIGVMFGNPETTTGGQALKFYASMRLDTRTKEVLKDKDADGSTKGRGRIAQVKIVKNKLAAPFADAMIEMGNSGIEKHAEILMLGVKFGFIKKGGSYYRLPDDTLLGGSKDKAVDHLRQNVTLAEELTAKIIEKGKTEQPEIFEGEGGDESGESFEDTL